MPKIRASYSFLHLWEQGQINQALLSYFHVPHPTPPNYINGRKWDDYCQSYITKHAKLPPEWGGDKLKRPTVQLKKIVDYNAIATLTGVFDIYDNKTIYELKSGHSGSARGYANTKQLPLYFLLAEIANIPVKNASIIRYNPKTDSQDRAQIYPSSQILQKASNYIDSIVPEIYEYFIQHNLFNETDESMAKILHSY